MGDTPAAPVNSGVTPSNPNFTQIQLLDKNTNNSDWIVILNLVVSHIEVKR